LKDTASQGFVLPLTLVFFGGEGRRRGGEGEWTGGVEERERGKPPKIVGLR